MNIFQHGDSFEKTVQLTRQVVGCILTVGLASILIVAWILTEPVIQLVGRAAHRGTSKQGLLNRCIVAWGIGLALLVVGIFVIIYAFNASDSVSLDVPRAFAGAPTDKTLGLLLGGSAAVVVGVTLAVRSSGKPPSGIQPGRKPVREAIGRYKSSVADSG